MRRNLAKHKLAAGQPISVISPGHTSPSLVEWVASLGFDAVFLDGEHGSGDWEATENMIRAAELGGATPICRVQANEASVITRTLDRGAGGIQVPHVNTRQEVEAAVRHAKYAPLGERGWYGGRATYGVAATEYAAHANAETLLVVMLEETEALENLGDMLRVEHVDVFFVAPGDLAQSMGLAGQPEHPAVVAAVDQAVDTIRGAGRAAGVLTTPATVDKYLERGALYLYVGLANFVVPGARDYLARFGRYTRA
jgi:4-hydroxy-2-oxoheptanedioate aldolase